MYRQPPLLIIAPLADDFDLAQLPWCDAASAKVSVNRAKFTDLEMLEVIVDAMPFLLTRLTAEEAGDKLAAEALDQRAGDLAVSGGSAIGVALDVNLACASHLPEIHRRLLLLGRWIGESLDATAAAWTPAGKLCRFAWFDDRVEQYLAEGRFPSPFHISFSQAGNDSFLTRGLRYFTGQEIRLTVPPDYARAGISERVEQIVAELVVRGRIDGPFRSECPVRGESLVYTPGDNPEQVDILIRRDARDVIAAGRQGC